MPGQKLKNMKNNSNLVNPHFELVVLWIQSNIGKVIVSLLVLTYLGTALMIAVSLQHALLPWGATMSWIVAGCMAVLSQAIRGSLVYFNQANPYRVSRGWEYLGIVFAFALTVFACFEVYHLFTSQGLGIAAKISGIGLIVAGFFLEAYFLGEINRTNRTTLVANPQMIKDALAYEREYAELVIAMQAERVKLTRAKKSALSNVLTEHVNPAKKLNEIAPKKQEIDFEYHENGNGKVLDIDLGN